MINDLGFRPNVRRLPITEIGCIAGAMALTQARTFVHAFPYANVLVIAVELPSLTFQPHDTSTANLVASALFGDGAAAVLVTGREVPGIQIVDTASSLVPDTLSEMGFDLRDNGFHMVLSKDVPEILRSQIATLSSGFLGHHELSPQQLSAVALHPGGKKISNTWSTSLHFLVTRRSRPGMCCYGNLSSAAILFVLDEWLTKRCLCAGEYGLAAGVGPGLSAELLLLRWV